VRVARHHVEERVANRDLLRRSHEGGDAVAAGQGEVDELGAGPAGGTEDEDSLGHARETGRARPA
jgi:hypothetical protein